MRESDFTAAIRAVLADKGIMGHYPDGITPGEILKEVWNLYPGEFQLCTVIDVLHEKENIYS